MAEKDVVWCADAIERKMGYWDIKKHLLISGTPKHRIYEMLFIYDKVYKQLEGGKKNEHGRNQTSYRKGKDAKLPEVADETSTRIE